MVSPRPCKHSLHRPASLNAVGYSGVVNAYSTRPFPKAKRLAVECNQTSSAIVVSLLCSGGPFAVVLAIAKIVLDSFERVLWGRSRPHVAVERLEIKPFRTNRNAPPSVAVVTRMIRVAASVVHVMPCATFGCMAQAVLFLSATAVIWLGRIRGSHDGTPNTRLVRTANQRQLIGRLHFSSPRMGVTRHAN